MTKKLGLKKASERWLELKAMAKDIERGLAELKPVIEEGLADSEGSYEAHGWKFSLVKFEKESFSLSKAREVLDGRVLAPYITTSEVTQIRTSWQGGEEKEAA